MEFINVAIVIIGLIISHALFYKLPTLEANYDNKEKIKVSIVIPARNEESKINFILEDLLRQSYPIYEIICVDDCSFDKTAAIASKYNVKLIKLTEKPKDWIGKSWACYKGAEISKGDVLIFMDADLRISQNVVERIVGEYLKKGHAISVQPYHKIEKFYENFSLIFNLMQIAAYGIGLPWQKKNVGLYGPIILIEKNIYDGFGGHYPVRKSIIDDVALGRYMTKLNIPFSTFVGDKDISFRMYGDGFSKLVQGWTKNVASGAVSTFFYLIVMVSFWMTSVAAVCLYLLISFAGEQYILTVIYIFLYVIWIFEIKRIGLKLGNFKFSIFILFPVAVWFFIGIFAISMFKKIFHIKVTWKDRKIEAEK